MSAAADPLSDEHHDARVSAVNDVLRKAVAAGIGATGLTPAGGGAWAEWLRGLSERCVHAAVRPDRMPPGSRSATESPAEVAAHPDRVCRCCGLRVSCDHCAMGRDHSDAYWMHDVAEGSDQPCARLVPWSHYPGPPWAEGVQGLRVGDEVPVRWLDGAGYHHARGVVTPADGELKPLRVTLRPSGRHSELPTAAVVDLLRECSGLIAGHLHGPAVTDLLRRIDAATAEPEEGP